MKKKRNYLLLALLLLAVVSSLGVVGTYSKYTSTVTGSDDARVALWSWTITQNGGAGAALTATSTLDSFDLFKRSELLDNNCSVKETDVKTGVDLVAPGTCGKFSIGLTNNSEVNAKYSYALSLTNDGNIPLEFSLVGTPSATDWTSDLETLAAASGNVAMGDTVADAAIYWRWAYEVGTGDELVANDAVDTALGFAGTATVTVDAELTLTQVD